MTRFLINKMLLESDIDSILNSGVNFSELLFEEYEKSNLEELIRYRTDFTATCNVNLLEVGRLPSFDEISKPGSLYEFSIDQRIYTEKLLGKPSEGPSPPYIYN